MLLMAASGRACCYKTKNDAHMAFPASSNINLNFTLFFKGIFNGAPGAPGVN